MLVIDTHVARGASKHATAYAGYWSPGESEP